MSEISERLRLAREKSKKRKELLDCTLGSSWAEELGSESSIKSKKLNDDSSKASTFEPQNHGLDRLSVNKTPLDPVNIASPSAAGGEVTAAAFSMESIDRLLTPSLIALGITSVTAVA